MSIYCIDGTALNDIAYNVGGQQLQEAYDIQGGPLFDGGLIVNQDMSTGTDSGIRFVRNSSGSTYVLREMIDFLSDSPYLQSFGYNYDDGKFYKFDETTGKVKVYNSSMVKIDTITLPGSIGHANDSAYCNGSFYFPNIDAEHIIEWNINTNTITTHSITGITQPSNGRARSADGICEKNQGTGVFYLSCKDYDTSDPASRLPTDKLSIYECDISTGACTLKHESLWDDLYIQGCILCYGIIYVSCNIAEGFSGMELKAIRTDTWARIESLFQMTESGEGEGMDKIPVDGGYEIEMGIGKWAALSKAVRFTPPYALEETE